MVRINKDIRLCVFAVVCLVICGFIINGIVDLLQSGSTNRFIRYMDHGGAVACGLTIVIFTYLASSFIRLGIRQKFPAKLVRGGIAALIFICMMAVTAIFVFSNFNNNFDGTRDYPDYWPPSMDQP